MPLASCRKFGSPTMRRSGCADRLLGVPRSCTSRTRVKNKIQSVLHANLDPASTQGDLFLGEGRTWLAVQPLDRRRACDNRRLARSELDRLSEGPRQVDASLADIGAWRRTRATADDDRRHQLDGCGWAGGGDRRRRRDCRSSEKLVSYFGLNRSTEQFRISC